METDGKFDTLTMETVELTKRSKPKEVMQLDDSRYDLKSIRPGSSSVRKDIVIRLKSGDGKPSKSILKNPNKSREGIKKSIQSEDSNGIAFTEVKETSTDSDERSKEFLDCFETNAEDQSNLGNILLVKPDIDILSSENREILIDEIEKKDFIDSSASVTENKKDYFSSKSQNDSAEFDRDSSTKISGTHEQVNKNSENMLICDNSIDYVHTSETRELVGQNIWSSGMVCEDVSIVASKGDNGNSKQTNFAKVINNVKSLKRCADESISNFKPAKQKKSENLPLMSQYTNLEHDWDSDYDKQKSSVFPSKESSHTLQPEDKLAADEDDSFLICDEISEDESWGIVDSTGADEIEAKDQHTELSPRSKVLPILEDDKMMQQRTNSESSLPYSILPNGCTLEGVITIKHETHDTYFCKACDRTLRSRMKDVIQHVAGKRHKKACQSMNGTGVKRTATEDSDNNEKKMKADEDTEEDEEAKKMLSKVEGDGYIEKRKNAKRKTSYYCRICDFRTKVLEDITEHMHGNQHQENICIEKEKEMMTQQGSYFRGCQEDNYRTEREKEMTQQGSYFRERQEDHYRTENLKRTKSGKDAASLQESRTKTVSKSAEADSSKIRKPHLSVLHNDGITFHNLRNKLYCRVCSCTISKSRKNLREHKNGKSHKMAMQDYKNRLFESSMHDDVSVEPDICVKYTNTDFEESRSPILHNDAIGYLRNKFYCKACSCTISKGRKILRGHISGKSHKMALQDYKNRLLESSMHDTVSVEPDICVKHANTDFLFQESRSPSEDEIGYHERTGKRGNQYYCAVCNFHTRDYKAMGEHRHGRKHKEHVCRTMEEKWLACEDDYERTDDCQEMEEQWLACEDDYERTDDCQEMEEQWLACEDDYERTDDCQELGKEWLSYQEDYAKAEEETLSQLEYYRSLDRTYNEEPYQNREEASLDNDYQSDVLWNECYERFMHNIIKRDRLDPPMNSEIPSPLTEHQELSENDPSFQSAMEQVQTSSYLQPELIPTPNIPSLQQSSVLSMSHLQHTNTEILAQPTNFQPQLNTLPASLQSSVPEAESTEQNQVNGTSYNYLQNYVTNDSDAETAINIIQSLLQTYLKYKLNALPGSLLKLLYSPSKTGKNLSHTKQARIGRNVKQLLIDLENHNSKFVQTFTPVTDNSALSSDHNSDVNEMFSARSNVTLNENEDSLLVSIKKPESSINYLFNQYRNRTNEKRAIKSCSQDESFACSSKHYQSCTYEDSSSKSNKPLNSLLMAYVNKNSTDELNSIEDGFRTKQNEPLATDVSEQYRRYNEYNFPINTNQNVSSVGTFAHQNRQSNHGNDCLETTNQHLSSFINLSKKQ